MSAVLALLVLSGGSGLILLGAVFFWRWARYRGGWWVVLATFLPVGVVALGAALCGLTEMMVGVIWGSIFCYLLWGLVINCCCRKRLNRATVVTHLLWLACGLGACLFAGWYGGFGVFSGWSLVGIGMIVLWQWWRQPAVELVPSVKVNVPSETSWSWWQGLVLVMVACAGLCGVGLLVWQQATLCAVLGFPQSICATVIIAPCLSAVSWVGYFGKPRVAAPQMLHAWSCASVLLSTLVLGMMTVITGGFRLTQSTLVVTLPWCAVLLVLTVLGCLLPIKSAKEQNECNH